MPNIELGTVTPSTSGYYMISTGVSCYYSTKSFSKTVKYIMLSLTNKGNKTFCYQLFGSYASLATLSLTSNKIYQNGVMYDDGSYSFGCGIMSNTMYFCVSTSGYGSINYLIFY